MLLADALEAQDDPDDAEAAYREAARLSPEDPEPLLALADMHDRAGRANQARQIWRSILTDVDSRNAAAHEALVRSYITARMVPQAQQQLAQIESLKLSGPPIERSRSLLTLYLSSDDPRTRLTHYRKVLTDLLAESPDDGMSQLHLAFSFAMERRYDDALRALNTLLQRQPEHMQGRELRVDLLRNLLRQDEAAAVLDDMIAERPRYARWREMALQVALDRVDIDRALAELDGLIARPDLQDRHVIWRNQKVQLLLSIGRADQGVALARALHEEKPDDPLRRDAFLGALSWAGRKDEAVTEALRLHEANPTRLDLRAALISKLITAGRTTEATQRVLAWMEDEPQADLLMRLLISALYESRQYDEVIALAHSTRIDTDLGLDSYRTLLNSYVRTGRVRDAESLIEQFTAPERGLQSVDANAELADVYYQSGRLAEARRMIERIIAPELTAMRAGEAVDLTLTGLWIQQLANIMDRLGDDAEGEALLEELYHATPESAGINNDLGYLWADAGKNLAQAEKMIRLAVSLNPRQSAYLDSLGWARYKRGAFDDAVEWIRRAVYWSDWQARQRDEPVDPVLADHYGDALYRAGRRDDARAWWTRSIEALIDPRYRVLDAERDGALKIATQAKIAALDGGGDPEVATAATDGG
jgi:pentatricopeptide repeat protein